MYSFQAMDIHDALSKGLQHLLNAGVEEQTRNGPVLVAPGPVLTEYTAPRRRVLLSPTRDANPWFHAFEGAYWMLSGSNNLTLPCYFVKSYADYSDDGGHTMWDAYGWRWREFFGWDQVKAIVEELRKNPNSRRCVLTMWSASEHHIETGIEALAWRGEGRENFYTDFDVATHGGKAVPCNTHCYFDLRGGALNLTVCNRSNDVIFGFYGANVVQFSFLQEYIATQIGAPMGVYRQFSNNFHIYTDRFNRAWMEQVIYECDTVQDEAPGTLLSTRFDADLAVFMPWMEMVIKTGVVIPPPELRDPFTRDTALPMFLAWTARKSKDLDVMRYHLSRIQSTDWRRACIEWAARREMKKETTK